MNAADQHSTHIDQKTQELEALLLQIAHAAEQSHKQYYFGGGFAIDLTFGGLTRPHEDLDFYPLEADTQWWKEWFRAAGYVVSQDTDMTDLQNAFSILRPARGEQDKDRDYLADVYPIAVADDGTISMQVSSGIRTIWDGMLTVTGDRAFWPGKSWHDVRSVTYKGQTVVLENCKTALAQKEAYIKLHPGQALSEKHLHDFARANIRPSV